VVCLSNRAGEKRNNWLLIKHRDEFVREGEANDILDEDRSAASGRTMEQIAAGKGRSPKPFITAKTRRINADAVWHSNRGMAADARAGKVIAPVVAKAIEPQKVGGVPGFVTPQLCTPDEKT